VEVVRGRERTFFDRGAEDLCVGGGRHAGNI
jgi:hypothetical protein